MMGHSTFPKAVYPFINYKTSTKLEYLPRGCFPETSSPAFSPKLSTIPNSTQYWSESNQEYPGSVNEWKNLLNNPFPSHSIEPHSPSHISSLWMSQNLPLSWIFFGMLDRARQP